MLTWGDGYLPHTLTHPSWQHDLSPQLRQAGRGGGPEGHGVFPQSGAGGPGPESSKVTQTAAVLFTAVSLARPGLNICGMNAADRQTLAGPAGGLGCPGVLQATRGPLQGDKPSTGPVLHRHFSVKSLIWVSNLEGLGAHETFLKNKNKTVTSTFWKDQMEFYFLASA